MTRITVAVATKTIREAIDLPELTPDKAKQVWSQIQDANLQNHGGLLYELFMKCPFKPFEAGPAPRRILEYLHESGSGFPDEVIQNFSTELLFRMRVECRIPPEKMRPLIHAQPDLIRWVWTDVELYDDSLKELLLGSVKTKDNFYGNNECWALCHKLPAFWQACRDELLPFFVQKKSANNLSTFLEAGGDLLPVESRFELLQNYLTTITKNSDLQEGLRKVYDLSLKYLPIDKQKEFYVLIEAKVDEILKAEAETDPLKAFLHSEMSWKELAFARLDPEGYQKQKKMEALGQGYPPEYVWDHPFFPRMIRRLPYS